MRFFFQLPKYIFDCWRFMLDDVRRRIPTREALVALYSQQAGMFPDQWKKGRVIPVHKKGDDEDSNNFRSISILGILSKITERHVHKYV